MLFTAQQVWKVIKNAIKNDDQATVIHVVPDLVWYCESEGTERPASHTELRSSRRVPHIRSAPSKDQPPPKEEAKAITAGAVDDVRSLRAAGPDLRFADLN